MKRTNTAFQPSTRRSFYSLALISLLFVTSLVRVNSQATAAAAAQTEADRAELYQSLLDLTNPWTVMCVAAHPDDEDGATLTVLRRKYGAHTVSLFSTFGEGGQNAIGPELYEELGAIRARETVKAAEIQGSEAHFLGLKDFGFSKSADEAFRVWGHDEALRRMVLEIRRLRPDVIITNHDTTGGHGHHQATGRLVLEAFDAAADPKKFPEQLKEVQAWQVQRLFVRMNYEGLAESKKLDEEAEKAGKFVTVNRNEPDPVRGTTYAEQALHALQQHASQGPWPQTLPKEGWPPVRYRLAREAKEASPLPATPQTFLDGLRLPEKVAPLLAAPTIEGKPLTDFISQPGRALSALTENMSRKKIRTDRDFDVMKDPHYQLMVKRISRAVTALAGITLTLTSSTPVFVLGGATDFSLKLDNNGDSTVRFAELILNQWGDVTIKPEAESLKPHSSLTIKLESIKMPAQAQSNLPHAEHLYDGNLFGKDFTVTAQLAIDNQPFTIWATSQLDVAPQIEIQSVTASPLVLTPAMIQRPVIPAFRLINHMNTPFVGKLKLDSSILSSSPESDTKFVFTSVELAPQTPLRLEAGEAREVKVPLTGLNQIIKSQGNSSRIITKSISFKVIGGSSERPLAQERRNVVYSDARVAPNLHVGYVRSTDDTLRNALNALGVEAQELKAEEVASADLSKFDTVIIDNRGYQLHPELIAANPRLLDYAKNGGTLIVFYHKSNEWNPDAAKNRPQLAPLPITLGGERVTDENASITFTEAEHPLLNLPNKITQDDFKDWIQERGLYYPKTWDAGYHAPFAMSDAGEEPLRGGLLALDTGRGHYIYTSMVWYRQLRAGVPGAYRVFANMISYGHTK